MYQSNYDKFPSIKADGNIWSGWDNITTYLDSEIKKNSRDKYVVVVETHQGVHHKELLEAFGKLNPDVLIHTDDIFYPSEKIKEITHPDVTDDQIFGFMTRLTFEDIIDKGKLLQVKESLHKSKGLVVVYGYAASLVEGSPDLLLYADMPRWELQLRQRRHEVNNIGIVNSEEAPALQYKRGFFVDWRICDKQKKKILAKVDYWLDTVTPLEPKMISGETMLNGLNKAVAQPFRVVPFFDPGPWGGQWMKEKCDLDKSVSNFAWCFDCVPEENSLLFNVSGVRFELPSINLVFYKTRELLGEPVESRFGQEFPIRFDFLDTMDGGNLSLQVHPLTQYIRDQFGMYYTQDESYYMLDAKPGAEVYLGVKEGIDPSAMINDLTAAQEGKVNFDADRYVNKFPAKKHDHFLIPNGTIHCSGANSMVLEISATPYIFTFKLWDWGRLGLDGKPRPINIRHGANVIQWERDTTYCLNNLVNQFVEVQKGEGWREEKTGLHKNEFIETRRHWFTGTVEHKTLDSVNVLNLIEGREAIVESPDGKFEPFVVHYAETFIIPAAVGRYTIAPFGESAGKECATIKAYVRL